MDIQSDRQKGLSYTELGRKYHIDPQTVKRQIVELAIVTTVEKR